MKFSCFDYVQHGSLQGISQWAFRPLSAAVSYAWCGISTCSGVRLVVRGKPRGSNHGRVWQGQARGQAWWSLAGASHGASPVEHGHGQAQVEQARWSKAVGAWQGQAQVEQARWSMAGASTAVPVASKL
eukprot:scaffold156203_cov23-Tisochrysis_lutea.AAC.1